MGTPVETNTQLPTTKPTTNNAQDEEFSDPRISQHCSGQARPWRCSPRSSSCCPSSTSNSPSRCPSSTSNSPSRCPPSTRNSPSRRPPSTRNSPSRCPPSTSNCPSCCPLSSPAHAAPRCPPPPTCPP